MPICAASRRLRPLLFVCALALVSACGESTTIVKTVTTEAEPSKPAKVSRPVDPRASIGDLLTVASGDATLKVRLNDVMDPLPVGEYDSARAGHRFVGVELAVKNMGPQAYSDALSNGSVIVLRNGRQAEATIVSGGPCGNNFAVDVKIAADDKRVGCIAFEVPGRKRLRSFQFTPQSGFGDETGEWELPRSAPRDGGPPETAAPVPATAASTPAPAASRWSSCDANISAKSPGTTCEFASNLFYEYWSSGQTASVSAFSPATGTFHPATCVSGGSQVTCTSPDGAAVRFSQAAIDAYSQSQADQYAASHDVGH